MLRPRAIAIAVVVLTCVLAALMWGRRSANESEVESASEVESDHEIESEVEIDHEIEREHELESEREIDTERERETEREVPPQIQLSPGAAAEARMYALRRDVQVLEIQRLDARERGDTETEARLDQEIAAARAEHDRLRRESFAPEGI